MGACLCRGHKAELQLPLSTLHQAEEGQPSSLKDGQNPSNGTVADKSGHYDIGELATSSLMGLVATIKEHITKPTAMAQGRVAHLIEWKGWGGCGEAGGGGAGWSRGWNKGGGGSGWGGMGTELQEDEQYYSQMTDEFKEARFAAGVAEQFALAEAAMNVWCMGDNLEQPSTSVQAAQSHFLSKYLLDGGSVGVPQHLYSIHTQTYGDDYPPSLVHPPVVNSAYPTSSALRDVDQPFEDRNTLTVEAAVRHVDSSSLSEDDVFYN